MSDAPADTSGDPADHPLLAGLNPVQREAVTAPDGPMLVIAGAEIGRAHV